MQMLGTGYERILPDNFEELELLKKNIDYIYSEIIPELWDIKKGLRTNYREYLNPQQKGLRLLSKGRDLTTVILVTKEDNSLALEATISGQQKSVSFKFINKTNEQIAMLLQDLTYTRYGTEEERLEIPENEAPHSADL